MDGQTKNNCALLLPSQIGSNHTSGYATMFTQL